MTEEDYNKIWTDWLGSNLPKTSHEKLYDVLTVLQNPIRSDDGLYDYPQACIDYAISTIKKVMDHDD